MFKGIKPRPRRRPAPGSALIVLVLGDKVQCGESRILLPVAQGGAVSLVVVLAAARIHGNGKRFVGLGVTVCVGQFDGDQQAATITRPLCCVKRDREPLVGVDRPDGAVDRLPLREFCDESLCPVRLVFIDRILQRAVALDPRQPRLQSHEGGVECALCLAVLDT